MATTINATCFVWARSRRRSGISVSGARWASWVSWTFGLSMDAAIDDVNSCVHGILGIHPDLTICWIRKWWLWRSLRLLHRHYHLLPLGRAQSCRDGIDGSHFRRSIPLGLRVLASRMAKGPVLLLRLDVHSWMARWYRWKHAGPCLSD